MSDLALNSDGDLYLVNNSLAMVDGAAAITQHLAIRYRFFLGEWFLDVNAGVPWFRDVLVKRSSFAVVHELLKNVALDTPGVLELLAFNFVLESATREATLALSVLSTEGFINFSQIVEVGS